MCLFVCVCVCVCVSVCLCVCVSLLQAAQRKMLDVLNSVGLGTSLLRIIERRQRLDIWITYGGMVSLVA